MGPPAQAETGPGYQKGVKVMQPGMSRKPKGTRPDGQSSGDTARRGMSSGNLVSPTGLERSCNFNKMECPPTRISGVENIAEYSALSNTQKETPVALAGATGADIEEHLLWLDSTLNRVDAASGLSRAILACDPADRVPLLEAALDHLAPDWPLPPFGGYLADAREWAGWAIRPQLKALALACYERLSARDQSAFLAHIVSERRAAA